MTSAVSIRVTQPIDFDFKIWSGDKDPTIPKRLFWHSTGSEKMKDIYELARKHKKNWDLDQV